MLFAALLLLQRCADVCAATIEHVRAWHMPESLDPVSPPPLPPAATTASTTIIIDAADGGWTPQHIVDWFMYGIQMTLVLVAWALVLILCCRCYAAHERFTLAADRMPAQPLSVKLQKRLANSSSSADGLKRD